jgi:hypothetical protein
MELPRGTFRSIRKGIRLGDLIGELITTRFTGICSFSLGDISGSLVFKGGTCVLAKVQDQYGDGGWAETRAQEEQVIDAVLSDLNATQLQLALEFNKNAYVKNAGGALLSTLVVQKTGAMHHGAEQKTAPTSQLHVEKEKEFIKTTPLTFTGGVHPVQPEKRPAPNSPEPGSISSPQKPVTAPDVEPSPTEKEYDSIDSMDFDDVTQKIRKDVKVILKQLQLEHLTEK